MVQSVVLSIVQHLQWPIICHLILDPSYKSSFSFCGHLFSLNLMELVNIPTHSHGNTLDLVLSNFPNLIANLSVISIHDNPSDHHLISFHLSFTNSWRPSPFLPCLLWNYSKADLDGLHSHFLTYANLYPCLQFEDVNTIWAYIKDHFLAARECFAPVVTLPKSPSSIWFKSEIHHLIKRCHTLWHKLHHHPTVYLQMKLNQLESFLQVLLESSKAEYIQHLVSSYHSAPIELFSHLHSLSKPVSTNYPIIHDSGPVSDAQKKAELYNCYFN